MYQTLIMALLLSQLIVGAVLDYLALRHYDYLVAVADSRKTVRNNDAGAAAALYVINYLFF